MREKAQSGRPPRRRIRPAIRFLIQAVLLCVLWISSAARCRADTDDGIMLLLHHGTTPTDVILDWTGGTLPYEIYRSPNPAALVTAGNKLAEANGLTWTDVPPPGGVHYLRNPAQEQPAAGPRCHRQQDR